MTTDVRSPWARDWLARRWGGAVLAAVITVAACSGGEGTAPRSRAGDGLEVEAEAAPPPTLAGGVALEELDPATVLVGEDLSFGTPLPSRQAAADAFAGDPEVATAITRAVYETSSGRRLGDVLVLGLVGDQFFDDAALAAFERGIVRSLSGTDGRVLSVAGRPVQHAADETGGLVLFREGNLLVVVTAPVDSDAVLMATRQIEARRLGAVGTHEPSTPLPASPGGAAFVPVPTIAFTPFPPPDEEEPPEPPSLAGASGVQGRYGVVAGERRSTVWAFTVDRGVHASAESLQPAMAALAAARAGGIAPETIEVLDRLVLASTAPAGEASARVFRHQGLVLLVEGNDPAQLDAVVTAWIAALDDQGL